MMYNSLLYRNIVSTLITTIPFEIWNRSADLADKPPYKLRYTKDGSSPFLFTLPCFKSSLCYVRINPFIEFYPMEHAYPPRSTTRINIHPLLFPFSHQFLSPPSLRFGKESDAVYGKRGG